MAIYSLNYNSKYLTNPSYLKAQIIPSYLEFGFCNLEFKPEVYTMPIKKAAKKSLRQTKKRTLKNKAIKENYKKLVKKAKKEITAKKKDQVAKTLSEIAATVDKAAKRGVIHKNKAKRIKARLMRDLNKAFDKKVTLVKRDRVKQEAKPKKEKEAKKSASTAKRGEPKTKPAKK